jgi:hypothetical protein
VRRWLVVGVASWLLCLGALVWILATPAPSATPAPWEPTPMLNNPAGLEELTCTAEVATVDAAGNRHITTVECEED